MKALTVTEISSASWVSERAVCTTYRKKSILIFSFLKPCIIVRKKNPSKEILSNSIATSHVAICHKQLTTSHLLSSIPTPEDLNLPQNGQSNSERKVI